MPRIPTGAILVVLLIGGLTFVGVKSTRHRVNMGAPPTSQPSRSPAAFPTSIGVVIPGCYNSSVPPANRPIKLNIVGSAGTAVALQHMSWSSSKVDKQ